MTNALLEMSLQLFFRLKRLTLVVNSRDYHPLDSSKDPFCKFLREAVALNRSIERSKLQCCQKTDVCARNYIYISRRRSGKKDLKDHLMEESVCYCTNSIFDNFKVVDGISQLYRVALLNVVCGSLCT